MTMQIMEEFEYHGELYDLAANEGFGSFHPPAVLRGIPFREPHTALHRGFQTTFSLNEKQWLVVRAIQAWVDPGFHPPSINDSLVGRSFPIWSFFYAAVVIVSGTATG